MTIDKVGLTVSLGAALTMTGAITLTNGTLIDNGYAVNALSYADANSSALTRSGAWELSGSGTVWNKGAGTTITDTGTTKLTNASTTAKTFAGGSKTYNNVWFASATTFQITGSNTFADFKADPGAIIKTTAGTTQTAASYSIDGEAATGSDAPCVLFDGVFGSNLSTANSAALQALVGDIDIDVDYGPDLWAAGTNSQVLGNLNQSSGTSGWRILKVSANAMRFDYSNGATVVPGVTATVAANTNGTFYRYRIKRIAATGMQTWYRSDDNGASWTPVAGPTARPTGNMAAPTLPLTVGESNASGFNWTGRLKSARVYAGDRDAAGVLTASLDPYLWTTGNTFTAATGEVWARAGNAQFTATNLTTIMGVTNAGYTLAKSGGGTVAADYISVRNCTASPTDTFYGYHAYDGGSNVNWIWAAALGADGSSAAATGAAGALAATMALPITGAAMTGGIGALAVDMAIPITGAAASGGISITVPTTVLGISGFTATTALGAVGIGIGLTGVLAGSAAGRVSIPVNGVVLRLKPSTRFIRAGQKKVFLRAKPQFIN